MSETKIIHVPNFISFEGIDGAGKTSHVLWLKTYLELTGHTVITTREPGGTPLGEKLRALLLADDMDDDTELLLMFASRKQLLAEVIQPALLRGDIVISDRFHDSSYAFQGGGRHLSYQRIAELDGWVGGIRPTLTLYFDIDVETANARLSTTRELDRFESEKQQFHRDVRAMYLRRAKEEPSRIRVIDGTQSIETIRTEIVSILKNYAAIQWDRF